MADGGVDDHAHEGVVGIAAVIRSGARSAVEVTEEHLAAAEASQDALNAFTLIDAEGALRRAEDIDQRIAAREPVGRLAGVPIGIKDLIDQAGLPNTNGANFPAPIPEVSATCVRRLEAADAVLIGRTGLHEWAFGFSSENPWFGPVRNPWDADLSPGGSSGGSATAVAAGLVAASLGTDTGGSVRVPAAQCGIVGLKVTHGRVPLTGVTPLAASVDSVGPLGRSVADVAAIYAVVAGDDSADPWSRPQRVVSPGAPTSLEHLRIGVPHPWSDQPVANGIRATFDDALDAIAATGAAVVHLDLPELDFPGMLNEAMYPEVARVHRERWQSDPDRYGPEVRRRVEQVFDYTMDDYIDGLRWRTHMQSVAWRALGEVDVLVTPTVASVHKTIGENLVEVDGEMVPYRPAMARFTAPVNHLKFPALALPLAGSGTPPASLQLIGAPWLEHHLLEIGAALENAGIAGVARPPLWRPSTSSES
ncbi:MAG: amidase [Acidimicrobiia bacterium]|nr:amidase [Acidimicrobiia bacterium]